MIADYERAISIQQPWAWAVAAGHKDVENRTPGAAKAYRGAIGKRIWIHASSAKANELERLTRWRVLVERGVKDAPLYDLQYGGIIGSVLLLDIRERSDSQWWMPGNHALILRDPRPAPFQPYKGQVGLWKVNP